TPHSRSWRATARGSSTTSLAHSHTSRRSTLRSFDVTSHGGACNPRRQSPELVEVRQVSSKHPGVVAGKDASRDFEDGADIAGVGAALEYVAALVRAIVDAVVRIADEPGPPLECEVDRARPVPPAFKVRDREVSVS